MLCTALALSACQTANTTPIQTTTEHTTQAEQYRSDVLIISYAPEQKAKALQAIQQFQSEIIYDYQNFNMLAIRVLPNELETIQQQLKQNPAILDVQRDAILQLHTP